MQLRTWIFQKRISQAEVVKLRWDKKLLIGAVLFSFIGASITLTSLQAEASAPAKEASQKSENPPMEKKCRWSEHESRLTSFASKIRSLEGEISELISQKKKLESPERVTLITQQITFKYKDLGKIIQEYEEERLHVRFQHPDREMESERSYVAIRLKSLEEIEEAFGLEGRMERLRKKVKVVFPIAAPAQPETMRAPASSESEDEKPERIRLVK